MCNTHLSYVIWLIGYMYVLYCTSVNIVLYCISNMETPNCLRVNMLFLPLMTFSLHYL